MKITIEEYEELKNIFNELDDSEYWEQQPQYKIEGFSDYIVYPKQGLIWSEKTNQWVGAKKKDGYWKCNLTSDDGTKWQTTLHRLVWIAVNGEIPQGYEVNHIDEDKSNCSISNLELVTHKENCNYGTRNERVSKAMKGIIPKANPPKQVAAFKDGQLIMAFPSTREAERNGYNQGNVAACCRNKLPHYKGYNWRYI